MSVLPADVAVELGRPAPESGSVEEKQWESWIKHALLLIQHRLGDLSALDQEVLDIVVTKAVAAKVKRPDPVRQSQHTVSVDDASVTRSSTYESASGDVTILDEWWDWLTPGSARVRGAFTVTPGARAIRGWST